MCRITLKNLYIALILVLALNNISLARRKIIYKYFISSRAAEIKSSPNETSKAIGTLEKDVRVKTICFYENWLLADIEYQNLSSSSLDDLNIHFAGWINKFYFVNIPFDEELNPDFDIKSPSASNTYYFPEDNHSDTIYKNLWDNGKKYYLFYNDINQDLFMVPNVPVKNDKITFINNQTPFIVTGKAQDWQGQDWMEIIFLPTGTELQRCWIKKAEIINEYENKALMQFDNEGKEGNKLISRIVQIKNIKIEIKMLETENEKLQGILDSKVKERIIITGNEEFDKKIREIEIKKINSQIEENVLKLYLLNDSLKAFDKKK